MRTKRTVRRAGFALAFAAQVLAYGAPVDEVKTFQSTYDGTTQPYRLFLPDDDAAATTAPRPLLVVLHGKGVDHNAWFDFTPVKDHAGRRGYVVAAPLGRGDWFYRGPGEQDVLDTIADAKRLTPIDPDRVYLAGHSMGGWGTWWIGLRNPDLFATIVPMAGWAPPAPCSCQYWCWNHDVSIGQLPTPRCLLSNAIHLDPLIIHDNDDPIVPASESFAAAERLAKLGISHRLRVEYGYGHASKMIGDNFDQIFDWLDSHRRPQQPTRVRIATRTPERGSAFWLGIEETCRFPRQSWAEASVTSGGVVDIRTFNVRALRVSMNQVPWPAPDETPKVFRLDGQTIQSTEPQSEIRFFYNCGPRDSHLAPSGDVAAGTWAAVGDGSVLPAICDDMTSKPDDPVRWNLFESLAESATSETIAAAVADHIWQTAAVLQRDPAQAIVLPVELFRRPPGLLTRAKMLDMYLAPDDCLVYQHLCADELLALQGQKLPPYGELRVYPNNLALDMHKGYNVYMPRFLWKHLKANCRLCPAWHVQDYNSFSMILAGGVDDFDCPLKPCDRPPPVRNGGVWRVKQ